MPSFADQDVCVNWLIDFIGSSAWRGVARRNAINSTPRWPRFTIRRRPPWLAGSWRTWEPRLPAWPHSGLGSTRWDVRSTALPKLRHCIGKPDDPLAGRGAVYPRPLRGTKSSAAGLQGSCGTLDADKVHLAISSLRMKT